MLRRMNFVLSQLSAQLRQDLKIKQKFIRLASDLLQFLSYKTFSATSWKCFIAGVRTIKIRQKIVLS